MQKREKIIKKYIIKLKLNGMEWKIEMWKLRKKTNYKNWESTKWIDIKIIIKKNKETIMR